MQQVVNEKIIEEHQHFHRGISLNSIKTSSRQHSNEDWRRYSNLKYGCNIIFPMLHEITEWYQ